VALSSGGPEAELKLVAVLTGSGNNCLKIAQCGLANNLVKSVARYSN